MSHQLRKFPFLESTTVREPEFPPVNPRETLVSRVVPPEKPSFLYSCGASRETLVSRIMQQQTYMLKHYDFITSSLLRSLWLLWRRQLQLLICPLWALILMHPAKESMVNPISAISSILVFAEWHLLPSIFSVPRGTVFSSAPIKLGRAFLFWAFCMLFIWCFSILRTTTKCLSGTCLSGTWLCGM